MKVFYRVFFLFFLVSFLDCISLFGQLKRCLVIRFDSNEQTLNNKGGEVDEHITNMLREMGFVDIQVLVNNQVTESNLISAFDGLTERSTDGDFVYIYLSSASC